MNRSSIAASIPVLALALLLTEWALAAEGDEGLYAAKTFVTGQGLANRAGGFARAFVEVLVKVSGDRRLGQRPEVADLAADAASDVVDFTYHDRMSGIPVHDEQGSRDRPFDLTVRFDPAKIDGALAALGSAPWKGPRPKLTMIVAVRNGSTAFVLASDGDRGRDMRDALEVAARSFALPVVLPETKVLAQTGIEPQTLPTPDEALAAAGASGNELAISGSLVWSSEALGWIADWHLSVDGKAYGWGTKGVSFDEAFRGALGGAAEILSGHGGPD